MALQAASGGAEALGDEKQRLEARLADAKKELALEKEAARSSALESERTLAKLHRCEAELGEVQSRLGFTVEEGRRHAARADELARQVESAQTSIDELRSQLDSEGEARRALVVERSELGERYEEARSQQQQAALQLVEVRETAERAHAELRDRDADAAQLKTLISRMELAHTEMAAKLETTLTKLSEAQASAAAEARGRAECAEQLSEREGTLREMRELVSSLDRERDGLALLVDEKAEEVHRLRGSSEASLERAADAERQLVASREQVTQQARLLSSAEAARDELVAKLDEATHAESAARSAQRVSEEELGAVTDDLGKMIRENQFLNEELQRSGRQGERTQAEMRRHEAKSAQLVAQLAAAAEEKEEIVRSYRRQADEVAVLALPLGPPLALASHGLRGWLPIATRGPWPVIGTVTGPPSPHPGAGLGGAPLMREGGGGARHAALADGDPRGRVCGAAGTREQDER